MGREEKEVRLEDCPLDIYSTRVEVVAILFCFEFIELSGNPFLIILVSEEGAFL